MKLSIASVLCTCGLAGVILAGCNDPAPVQAHRSAVLIGDRGISIPLPPPSVLRAPQQEVEVRGELDGAADEGAEVRLLDTAGGDEASVPVEGTGFTASLELDLTAACLEAWVVGPDGDEGEHRTYSTVVEDDESIRVVEGCDS